MEHLVTKVKTISEKAIDYMAVFMFCVLFLFGLMQVIWRFVLNNPLTWSEEAINILYVWICYLGWAIAERKDSHIRITALINKFPLSVQKYIQIFNHILCILFCFLMIYYGLKMTAIGSKRTAVSFPLNYAIVYVIGPISNLIISFYEGTQLVEVIKKGPKYYGDDSIGLEK